MRLFSTTLLIVWPLHLLSHDYDIGRDDGWISGRERNSYEESTWFFNYRLIPTNDFNQNVEETIMDKLREVYLKSLDLNNQEN